MRTLQDLHNEFISMQRNVRRMRETTIKSYEEAFRVFKKLTWDDITPDRLTPDVMTNFFEKLNTRERKVGAISKSGVKSSTTRTYYAKLNAFFKWLEKRKIIGMSPFEGIEIPKVKYEDTRYLTKSQVEKIMTTVTVNIGWHNDLIRKRNIAMFYILLFTGLRKGELLGLKILDFDFAGNMLTVRPETSKSKDTRSIPLNHRVMSAVKDYIEVRRGFHSEYLFITERGEAFTEFGLKHLVAKIVKESGIRFHVHRFRHTFAMNMINMGVDVVKLQYLMGHKDIRQTSVYLRKMPSIMVRNTVEFLDFDRLI